MKSHVAFSSRVALTLVEMLVAVAVLSLLLLLTFSIVGSTLKVSDSTARGADSAIEAKQVLDRIGADIAGMLVRPDVDQFYYSGNAATGINDKMFFYSQTTGFFDSQVVSTSQSPLALVGYRISSSDSATGVPVLERLAQGLIWDSGTDTLGSGLTMDPNSTTSPLTFLTFPARTSPTNNVTASVGAITNVFSTAVGSGTFDNGTSPYYDAIGSQTFRFEVCFQLQNGSYSQYPGYTNCAPVYPVGITNTVGIVVAIAVLDSKSRKLVPAASWTKMIAALPDPSTANFSANPPILMDSVWNSALNQSTFATTAGIPAVAASHIKVYQRYYYVNSPRAQ